MLSRVINKLKFILVGIILSANVYALPIYVIGTCLTGANTDNNAGGSCNDLNVSGEQDYDITFNACPKSTTPVLIIASNSTYYPVTPTTSEHYGFTQSSTQAFQSMCITTPVDGIQECTAAVIIQTTQNEVGSSLANIRTFDGTQANATYIISCE